MARQVEKDLHKQEMAFKKLLSDEETLNSIFNNSLTESNVSRLTELSFRLYAYNADTLLFWNNNKILADCAAPHDMPEGMLYNDRGFYIKKCVTVTANKNNRLVVLFPILISYPIENNYLRSRFVAADYIPVTNTRILTKPLIGSNTVRTLDKRSTFYLLFDKSSIQPWIPDEPMLILLLAAVLCSITWIHLSTIALTRRRSFLFGFIITLTIIIVLRGITYRFGLPFNLNSLPVFSPLLYASSNFLRSLGDLLLNAICFLWIIVFVLRHVPIDYLKRIQLKQPFKIILALLFSFAIILYAHWFINIISSIVLDSNISFDVSHFYSINSYTILGLFTIGIITGASCLFIYILNVQLSAVISDKWVKLLSVAGFGLIVILSKGKIRTEPVSYLLLLWLLIFLSLLDIKSLLKINDPLAPRMIFWGVFICSFCTVILQYFNHIREQETRKRFAEQLAEQRDDVTEYTFKGISQEIQHDKILKNFLQFPTPDRRRAINERFDALFLGGQLNKYQSKLSFFDKYGRPLYNSDTSGYRTLIRQLQNTEPVADSTLFYKDNAQEGHYYLVNIPIFEDEEKKYLAGFVFIDFALKPTTSESVYPELLQPGKIKSDENTSGYGYGIYVNHKLITQTSDVSFPIYLSDTLKHAYTFYEWENSSELWYKADKSKVIIVAYYHRVWLESITLFSYLFGIQMLVVVIITVYRHYLSYFKKQSDDKLINLTLRRRIHFSMLAIVLLSFFITGIVTIVFFNYQYKQSARIKLQSAIQNIDRSVVQYLKAENGLDDQKEFNRITNSTRFRYFISTLANAQKVDINIYNANGLLNVTSQENIYDKSLLARIIRPDAYNLLYSQGRSSVLQNEHIGALSYLSSYVPLRDEDGVTMGYINVPFFSSERELKLQISNILVALINLYAFIFLLSGVVTIFITRWLTRTFNVMISRFERISLSSNELIEWPYDDEIGLLIREYNKMVRKVEDSAVRMAQTEREMAWREMARQVAHEIKNPLTPMKLNIQHLQQALRNNNTNVTELAKRVSDSLIEQIDNLAYIASEFSNFAKMPEAKPEEIELNDLLNKAVELYLNEENTKVNLQKSDQPLYVYADKSQLVRVFSNLLQNAVQAIPEGRAGNVQVSISREGDDAFISVADNGNGISEEIIERIFQPYFTTKTSGTGLGLAMTKKIIEFWKGAIWFETKQGEGTTFYIRFPLIAH